GYRVTAPLRYVMAAIVTFLANLGRGRRPSANPLPRFESSRGGLSYRREKRRRFPITPVLLLIVVVVTTYLWVQNTTLKNAEQRYQDVLNLASGQLAVATGAPTDEAALKGLSDLKITLQNISDDSDLMADPRRKSQYERIRGEYDALLASIKRTSELGDIATVATLPISDTIGQLLAVPQGTGTELYFIGRESGTLYRQTEGKSGAPDVVLKEGESIPPIVTRRMRAMVWREGALAAIDDEESSTIYLSQPEGGWIAQRLDGSEFWPSQPFPDIETFGGSLYILPWGPDSEGEILKYASGEYANLPTPWISDVPLEVNLSTAVDMVIDGKIYLLQPDGAIEILESGQHLQSLPAPQLDPPLRASKMFLTIEKATETSPNLGHFYILDTFNSRVVELDMAGAVIQTLEVPKGASARLPQITDLAVVLNGAAGKRIYLADGDHVLSATLPPPPPPRVVPTAGPAQATPTP
ncbi:MAG TPA: hypothetical protein VD886_09175, partial [Herpetosiphonaceae bacterium]|nr:hypothetical protein [Herpetosiphonaceae bacterium]